MLPRIVAAILRAKSLSFSGIRFTAFPAVVVNCVEA